MEHGGCQQMPELQPGASLSHPHAPGSRAGGQTNTSNTSLRFPVLLKTCNRPIGHFIGVLSANWTLWDLHRSLLFPCLSPLQLYLGYFHRSSGFSKPHRTPYPQSQPLLCFCTGPSRCRYSLSSWPEKPHLFQEDLRGCLYPPPVSLYPTPHLLPCLGRAISSRERGPLCAWHHMCPRTPFCALARALPSSLSLSEGAQSC